MAYKDRYILEQRQRKKEETHQTLETGIYVDGKHIEFALTQLFNGIWDIMLPSDFIDMPRAVARIKYPSEQRPQIIKTSLSGRENFTFNLYDIRAENPESIRDICRQFQAALRQVNRSIRIVETDETEKNNLFLMMFSYISWGIDAQIYNLVCMTSLRGKLLQETFCCIYDDAEKWKGMARQVFLSAREHFL